MARPWKHPDSGIYYVRKAVSVSLRSLVGRSIEKLSLRTKDPDEARARFADAVREIEARWATLAAGPSALNEREAHELASPFGATGSLSTATIRAVTRGGPICSSACGGTGGPACGVVRT